MKGKLVKREDGLYFLNGEYENLIYGKLSIKNCQSIELGYDLDELAENHWDENNRHFKDGINPYAHRFGFKAGFQKALELMSDKKFSEEDVIFMIEKSRETGLTAEYLILTKQQTEWDVQIEMVPALSNNGNVYYGDIPKTDEDGCLILKRI